MKAGLGVRGEPWPSQRAPFLLCLRWSAAPTSPGCFTVASSVSETLGERREGSWRGKRRWGGWNVISP